MKSIKLIGGGGHGKVVADIAELLGYQDISFVDMSWPERTENGRWSIVGREAGDKKELLFCSIGDNHMRCRIFKQYALANSPVLAHPSAILSSTISIGSGTVVVAGVVVNADAAIGMGVILNTNSSVDHDCDIGDFVHVSPGASIAGGVTVGRKSWIGIGANIKEGVRIGENVIVAAGATVIHDVEDNVIVGGTPAEKIKDI